MSTFPRLLVDDTTSPPRVRSEGTTVPPQPIDSSCPTTCCGPSPCYDLFSACTYPVEQPCSLPHGQFVYSVVDCLAPTPSGITLIDGCCFAYVSRVASPPPSPWQLVDIPPPGAYVTCQECVDAHTADQVYPLILCPCDNWQQDPYFLPAGSEVQFPPGSVVRYEGHCYTVGLVPQVPPPDVFYVNPSLLTLFVSCNQCCGCDCSCSPAAHACVGNPPVPPNDGLANSYVVSVTGFQFSVTSPGLADTGCAPATYVGTVSANVVVVRDCDSPGHDCGRYYGCTFAAVTGMTTGTAFSGCSSVWSPACLGGTPRVVQASLYCSGIEGEWKVEFAVRAKPCASSNFTVEVGCGYSGCCPLNEPPNYSPIGEYESDGTCVGSVGSFTNLNIINSGDVQVL